MGLKPCPFLHMEISCIDLGDMLCSYGKTEKGLIYLVNKKYRLTEEEKANLFNSYGAKKHIDFNDHDYRKGKYLLDVAECSKPILIQDSQGYCIIPLLLSNGVTISQIVAHMPRYISATLDSWIEEHPNWKTYLKEQKFTEEDINLFQNCLGKRETSCGAVVYKSREVLLEHMIQGHTSIPKGHVEGIDASLFATAVREVKEETGIDIRRSDPKTYKIYYSPKEGVTKKVIFFLAEPIGGEEEVQTSEVNSIEWVDIDLAIEKVTYQTDKRVLKWAKSCLKL